MRARLLLPLLLASVWACSCAFAAQAEVDERTLRAGDSALRISVAAPSHARAEMLHRWLEADLALRARGSDLDAVLAKYARCCLRGTAPVAPEAYVAELGRVSGTPVFGELYQRYAAAREFPSLDAAYRQLGISASDDRLRFSQETAAARLRHAVLGRRSVGAANGQTSPL